MNYMKPKLLPNYRTDNDNHDPHQIMNIPQSFGGNLSFRIDTESVNNIDADEMEHKSHVHRGRTPTMLLQSATSGDEAFGAEVIPEPDASPHLDIHAKTVTFNNEISKYSPATPLSPSPRSSTNNLQTMPETVLTEITLNNSVNINAHLHHQSHRKNTNTGSLSPQSVISNVTKSSFTSRSSNNSLPSLNTPTGAGIASFSPSTTSMQSPSLNQIDQSVQLSASNNTSSPFKRGNSSGSNSTNNSNNNKAWFDKKLRLNKQQSSTSFKRGNSNGSNFGSNHSNNTKDRLSRLNQSVNVVRNIDNHNNVKIDASMIKRCPNLVNNKCRCKHILAQNHSAQRIWSGCYRIRINNKHYHIDNREIDIAYFDGLYGKLCKHFENIVDTDRIPTKKDISAILKRFGGFIVDDKNTLVIDRCYFVEFWKWWKGCCNIIKDVYNLWDPKFPFQINIFINRKDCQQILDNTPQGTFMLRLSHSQKNGLVLSYIEPTVYRSTLVRHILLIRQQSKKYVTKTNKNSHKSTELSKLIRSFVKLQFVYTPKSLYKKEVAF